jgi:hypothetical protein
MTVAARAEAVARIFAVRGNRAIGAAFAALTPVFPVSGAGVGGTHFTGCPVADDAEFAAAALKLHAALTADLTADVRADGAGLIADFTNAAVCGVCFKDVYVSEPQIAVVTGTGGDKVD